MTTSQYELDGFTYLGFFAWRFFAERRCRVCAMPAEGYAVVIGRGDEYLLRLCATCGRAADEHMSKHGVSRRSISPEQKQRILEEKGPAAIVATRFGVSVSYVDTCRREARGTLLRQPIPEEKKEAIRQAAGGSTEIARRFGVSRRSVYRIRKRNGGKVKP